MSSLWAMKDALGATMSEEDKQKLEEAGEKYFQHIDVDKYKPVPADEFKYDDNLMMADSEYYEFERIVLTLKSGLEYDDLTEREQELFTRLNINERLH